jgi:hypothetical protein
VKFRLLKAWANIQLVLFLTRAFLKKIKIFFLAVKLQILLMFLFAKSYRVSTFAQT